MVYQIEALSVVIRTTFQNFDKIFLCREKPVGIFDLSQSQKGERAGLQSKTQKKFCTKKKIFLKFLKPASKWGRSTLPKKAGKFQNNLHAFSKERGITDANYQRKSLQFWRQYVCNCKLNNYFGPKKSKLQIFSLKI